MLTEKQQMIYNIITRFIEEKGYSPSIREICAEANLRSPATVHQHIKLLKQKGYLSGTENKKRAIFDPKRSTYKEVPMIGTITAGVPVTAYENIEEYYPIPATFARGKELFILTVKGDSMVQAGIFDKDKVIVEKRQYAENGEIIAALIDDSATVKRYFKENGKIRLQPENEAYEPIIVDDVYILGVVKGLFREL